MRKIPTLFMRDFTQPRAPITREYHPDVDWVLRGEGIATQKLDGTAALVRDGMLYKRYMLRPGKTPPPTFEAVEHDEETSKTVGWVLVSDGPGDRWFIDALQEYPLHTLPDGTYELIGPKVQGNPENTDLHELVAHNPFAKAPATVRLFFYAPTDYDELKAWLTGRDIEGVVWQHHDGRMAKIKLADFGLKRGGG
jgi:hypothetical protein